jgi:hypothetical protein
LKTIFFFIQENPFSGKNLFISNNIFLDQKPASKTGLSRFYASLAPGNTSHGSVFYIMGP